MIKASEGGGGKGIRKVENPDDFNNMFRQVRISLSCVITSNSTVTTSKEPRYYVKHDTVQRVLSFFFYSNKRNCVKCLVAYTYKIFSKTIHPILMGFKMFNGLFLCFIIK